MICHKRKLIFVHIPKNGGSTIETLFGCRKDHADIATLREHVRELGDYKSITIVRNPWDRVVSSFCFSKRPRPVYSCEYDTKKEFKNFVFETAGRIEYGDDELFELAPQADWIMNNGEPDVDEVYRYDNFIRTVKNIFKDLGLDYPPTPIPHINKTVRDHYSNFYDHESMRVVGSIYEKEIKMFGFNFESLT